MKKIIGARFPQIAALLLVFMLFDATGLSTALAKPSEQAKPTSNPTKVYFTECGHNLADRFLTYWRTHGREQAFGCPITEQVDMNGIQVQYFSKARLEYHPENAGTPWEYSFGLIGTEVYNAMTPDERANPAYNPVAAFQNTKQRLYFGETGHSLGGGFKDFWQNNNGIFNYGFPISEEYPYFDGDKGYSAQDFERARFLYNPTTGVILAPLGPVAARVNGVDTNAVPQEANVPAYSPNVWEHWVDVNLRTQTAQFMEGDQVVRKSLVTTGKPGYATPTGTFYILYRVYNEHMRGGTIGAEDYYDLYNVLYTQYFTWEGHALHYAWWRSQFGVTGSHGCVNMDYDTSFFAWNWVGVGSRVYIHY